MVKSLHDFLNRTKMPEPADYEDSPMSHFATIVENEEVEANKRIIAAIEMNSLKVMYNLSKFSTYHMTSMAYEDALKDYKRDFIRKEEEENYLSRHGIE
jgi:hypothetical protein